MRAIAEQQLIQKFGAPALAACGIQTPDLEPTPESPLVLFRSAVKPAWIQLQAQAKLQGFNMRIESGHRPFAKQLSIWNRKARGELPLLDPNGNRVERSTLSDEQCLEMILNWSALPGTSRHHWGTDLDVIDTQAISENYEVQLTPEETEGNGPFAPLHHWLDRIITNDQAFGFCRVFTPHRGLVRPERWHLSYIPAAISCENDFNPDLLPKLYSIYELDLMETVLAHLPYILDHYVYPYFQNPRCE